MVKAGKSRFSLQTLPAEDFPKLAKATGDAARFAMPQKALRRLLGLVQYAMAQQDIRYYLNGLLHFTDDTNLAFVPIKFAQSPYLLTNFPPTLIFSNDFENATAKVYQVGSVIRGGTNEALIGHS